MLVTFQLSQKNPWELSNEYIERGEKRKKKEGGGWVGFSKAERESFMRVHVGVLKQGLLVCLK